MKKIIRSIAMILIGAPIIGLGVSAYVSAQVAVLSDSTTASNTESSPGATGTSGDKDLENRLTQREDKLKIKLTNQEQNQIKTKCQGAQEGPVKSLSGRINGIQTSRGEVYKNLVNRLNSLNSKLKSKGVDTTKLESEITTLTTKITKFNTDLAAYKQDITDLKGMNCATDPTGFKASLEDARNERLTLVQDALDIRNYVNNTIKPTLKDIRSQIEAQNQSNNNKATNTTGGSQ